MGLSGRIGYILHILVCLGQGMQVLYLGRAPRTKETLPDFLKWRRVTRHPLVFRGMMGSQRTPGFGASEKREDKFRERDSPLSRSFTVQAFFIKAFIKDWKFQIQ